MILGKKEGKTRKQGRKKEIGGREKMERRKEPRKEAKLWNYE